LTPGVNRLPPVGLMTFSVGDAGGALEGVVAVVVVVVVDVEGACSPLWLQPALSAPSVMSAPPPATAIVRRINIFELMITTISQTTRVHKARQAFPNQLAADTQLTGRRRCGNS
jgi:hypothetical protein